jgi:thiamine pyrophosphate-dependent acetolactate synthase large subunit-like protein
MVPIRGRNFGQLGAAVRFAYNRVAEIEAFKSALDASLRMHGPMLIEVTHDRSGAVLPLASGGA